MKTGARAGQRSDGTSRKKRTGVPGGNNSSKAARGAGKRRADSTSAQRGGPRPGVHTYALLGCTAIGLTAGVALTALTGHLAFGLSTGSAGTAASGGKAVAAVAGLIAATIAAGVLCGAVPGIVERRGRRRRNRERGLQYRRAMQSISLTRAMCAAAASTSAGVLLVVGLALAGGWLYPSALLAILALFYVGFVGLLICFGTYVGVLYVAG